MDVFKIFQKKKITKGFFVTAFGNDRTRGLYTFQIDIDTGELMFKKHFVTPSDPISAFNYGRFVMICYKNRTGSKHDGGIASYAASNEILALASRLTDEGKSYTCCCTNGSDEIADRIFAIDENNKQIAIGNIRKRKMVKVISTFQLEEATGLNEHQREPMPNSIMMNPANDRVIVTDLGADKVYFLKLENGKNLVIDKEQTITCKPESGPVKVIFNKDNTIMYVLNKLSCTIDVYKYQEGITELIQTIDSYNKKESDYKTFARNFKIDKENKHLYVVNEGDDSLVLFDVLEDGRLKYCDFVDVAEEPVDLAIYNEKFIVVVSKRGGLLESFQYSSERGGLLLETKSTYMVHQPNAFTEFVNNY